jgi:hypothetical protein
MNPKILSLGALFLCIAEVGCAASNGGGFVVGNPLVTSAPVQDEKKPNDQTCDCKTAKDPKVKKICKCGTSTSTSTSTTTSTTTKVVK